MTQNASAESLLAEALNMQPEDISEDTNIESCENWDSLAHLRVVTVLEEALGRSLSTMEIFEVTELRSVQKLLQAGEN